MRALPASARCLIEVARARGGTGVYRTSDDALWLVRDPVAGPASEIPPGHVGFEWLDPGWLIGGALQAPIDEVEVIAPGATWRPRIAENCWAFVEPNDLVASLTVVYRSAGSHEARLELALPDPGRRPLGSSGEPPPFVSGCEAIRLTNG